MVKKIKVSNLSQTYNKKKILVIPDIHFPDQDDRSLEIIYHVLKCTKFDEVIQLGDMLDMYSLSSFSKDPDKVAQGLKCELNLAKTFLKKIRKLQPTAKVTLIKGNHEERFERYIKDKAPGLCHLIDFREMLGLEALNINYVNDFYRVGRVAFTHGTLIRAHSAYTAKAHFDKYNMSMIHGHTHRMGSYYKTNLETTYVVHELGCLMKFYPDYAKSRGVTDWQQGFGIVYVDNKTGWFFTVPFPIVNHTCIYKDKVIKA